MIASHYEKICEILKKKVLYLRIIVLMIIMFFAINLITIAPITEEMKLKICMDNEKLIARALEEYRGERAMFIYPGRLSALVPRYLENIPRCPTSIDGEYGYQGYANVSNYRKREEYFLFCNGKHKGIERNYPKMSSCQRFPVTSHSDLENDESDFEILSPDFEPDFKPWYWELRKPKRLVRNISFNTKEIINYKDGSVLILISSVPSCLKNDRKKDHLDDLYIGKYEVTNEQFAHFVWETGYRAQGNWNRYSGWGRERHPVVGTTWNDAMAYCNWAGLRLPSIEEWERAATGGDGRHFPWGDEWDAKKCTCWDNRGSGTPPTRPVGSLPLDISPYGVFDMAGNVMEWCSTIDRENRRFDLHCICGGSWNHVYPSNFYCDTWREARDPTSSFYSLGFRVACSSGNLK